MCLYQGAGFNIATNWGGVFVEGTGESCGVRQRSLSCKKSTGGTGHSVMALIYSSLDAMKLSECAFP